MTKARVIYLANAETKTKPIDIADNWMWIEFEVPHPYYEEQTTKIQISYIDKEGAGLEIRCIDGLVCLKPQAENTVMVRVMKDF